MLKALLQVMQYLAQSPELLQAFMQRVDMEKFIQLLFNLSDVDITKIEKSQRDMMMESTAQQIQQNSQAAMGQQPPQPGTAAQAQAGQVAQMMGVAKP
jgi:hypothetical protein